MATWKPRTNFPGYHGDGIARYCLVVTWLKTIDSFSLTARLHFNPKNRNEKKQNMFLAKYFFEKKSCTCYISSKIFEFVKKKLFKRNRSKQNSTK